MVSARNFRPNVVVQGAGPWSEDEWKRVSVGSMSLCLPKPCTRCAVPTIHRKQRKDRCERNTIYAACLYFFFLFYKIFYSYCYSFFPRRGVQERWAYIQTVTPPLSPLPSPLSRIQFSNGVPSFNQLLRARLINGLSR